MAREGGSQVARYTGRQLQGSSLSTAPGGLPGREGVWLQPSIDASPRLHDFEGSLL